MAKAVFRYSIGTEPMPQSCLYISVFFRADFCCTVAVSTYFHLHDSCEPGFRLHLSHLDLTVNFLRLSFCHEDRCF